MKVTDHVLEAVIARLEEAATIWFNQNLHRDLQILIAAARRGEPSRGPVYGDEEAQRRRDERRAGFE